MYDRLEKIEHRYNELSHKISDAAVISDQPLFRTLCKEHAELAPVVDAYLNYKKSQKDIEDGEKLLTETDDREFKALIMEDVTAARKKVEQLDREIKSLLIPKNPNDDKNVIIEIRGGAGGDEAALFASDLFRMYSMYAEKNRFKIDIMNTNYTDIGGIKEISFMLVGSGAFSRLKFESGVHRVQRVPTTESQGRIHTSTVTVAVLPEAEEVEVEINPNDLKIDVFRAGGPGGQCVNTTDSAVRITHLPTGLTVSCQDEKSQHKNKDKGLKILRSRLLDLYQSQADEKLSSERKSQVGTGDRSERIRTYNFPQGRVSDHRINLTLHKLDAIMNGDLDELIDSLTASERSAHLAAENL